MRPTLRRIALALAVCCFGLAAWTAAAGGQNAPPPPPARAAAAAAARGRVLFAQSCSRCHGEDLRGIPGQGPNLRHAGAAAVDFYLSTGRMPIDNPTDQPTRTTPAFGPADRAALVAYIGAFGGPAIPQVHPERGSVSRGKEAFTERCAGCHQVVARGGIVTGAFVPALQDATSQEVGEAVRVGPYLMPHFSPRQVDSAELDDLAAYVRFTRRPDNRGGWAIGNIGPIPEGLVAWLLGGVVLLGVVRVLGERAS